jgi:uncharacterized damage-inducible protein DinB
MINVRTLIGRHVVVIAAIAAPLGLSAQSPTVHEPRDSVVVVFERWADIYGGWLVQAFDSIPAARYSYRPTPRQQSIGYIAQHLEDANYDLCERFAHLRHSRTAKDSLADTVKALWPKDTLATRLEASLQFCDSALERAGPLRSPVLADDLVAFVTDLAEHYSQISAYMRLLDMVPPSALPPRKRTAIELSASELRPYLGTYQVAPGLELKVTMRGDTLFAQSSLGGGPVHLWPERTNYFFVSTVDAQLTFTRDATDKVSGLILHQYGRDRFAKRIE